ncbi:MAG: hypothetical protein ACK4QW_02105 [Alphaproteobacteria bacterium]
MTRFDKNADAIAAVIAGRAVVALPELLRMARVAQGNMYNPTPLIAAALIDLAILWPVVRMLSRMERKMMAGR